MTGWFARNCATILRVLILKIAFEPEKFSAGAFEERAPGTFSLRLFLPGGGGDSAYDRGRDALA